MIPQALLNAIDNDLWFNLRAVADYLESVGDESAWAWRWMADYRKLPRFHQRRSENFEAMRAPWNANTLNPPTGYYFDPSGYDAPDSIPQAWDRGRTPEDMYGETWSAAYAAAAAAMQADYPRGEGLRP